MPQTLSNLKEELSKVASPSAATWAYRNTAITKLVGGIEKIQGIMKDHTFDENLTSKELSDVLGFLSSTPWKEEMRKAGVDSARMEAIMHQLSGIQEGISDLQESVSRNNRNSRNSME